PPLPRSPPFPYTTLFRSARSGETRFHLAQIQLELVGVAGGPRALVAPQALRLGVRAHQLEALARSAGQLEVAHRFRIDRKDAAGDRKSTRLNSSHLGISY